MEHAVPTDVAPGTDIARDCFWVIAYFSYGGYPLTAYEVWKWLRDPRGAWSLGEVMRTLRDDTWLRERVGEWNGFYGFGDVAAHVRDRHARYVDAVRKMGVLRPVVEYIGRLPGVAGVAVCNSLAYHHTTEKSDIDLFILTDPGRVWSVRLLSVAMMALLRKRPHEAARDPICCSFFVDADAHNLAPFALEGDDPYLQYWTATLVPLVEHSGTFRAFRAANAWALDRLPHARPVVRARAFRPRIRRRMPVHPVGESAARALQEKRFPKRIVAMRNIDTRVVVNDHVLKFHENDRRQEIAKALADKLA